MVARLTSVFELWLICVGFVNYSIGQDLGEFGDTLTVATVCMNAKEDTAINLETFAAYIKEASERGAKLIVFPRWQAGGITCSLQVMPVRPTACP